MSYQREYERRLRIGVVGVGSHAYRNILPALHYLPVSLVALCDVNATLLDATAAEYRAVRTYTDASEMYADAGLDAVLICAGARHHPALATAALSSGLHVWLEKPPAMRAAGVSEMIQARGDRVCAVGYKKAYMPAVRKAKELVFRPDFGDLRSLLAVYPMTIPSDGRTVLEGGGRSEWLSNGCHPLSVMVEVAGQVRTVTSLLGPGRNAVGAVHLEFAGGAVGTLHLAGGAPSGYPVERYDFFGRDRSVSIENSARVAFHRGIPFDYGTQRDFTGPDSDTGSVVWELEHRLATLENKALFVQGVFDELMDFCQATLSPRPLRTCDLEFALHLMKIYEAGMTSAGSAVTVS